MAGGILEAIAAARKKDIERCRLLHPWRELEQKVPFLPPPRSLSAAVRSEYHRRGRPALIAEVKRYSPVKGWLAHHSLRDLVTAYAQGGATAVSVITENRFFRGHNFLLSAVRHLCRLPLLRKDFIVDPYQILEARVLGADAVLLIASLHSRRELAAWLKLAADYGLECLVEVHSEEELADALAAGAKLIGINNRCLHTFTVDLNVTYRLRRLLTDPDVVLVSESGINRPEQIAGLAEIGVEAVLVGEALVRSADPERKIRELLGDIR